MTLRYIFFLWLFSVSNIGFAQKKQGAIWYYGDNQKIDFLKNPIGISKAFFGGSYGTASICDSNGNYLFSCNGLQTKDRRDSLMPNGFILNPGIFPPQYDEANQAGCNLIIPFLGSSFLYHLYVVYTAGLNFSSFGNDSSYLGHRVVDTRLNGGLGDILPVADYRNTVWKGLAFQLTCALHANGQNTWLTGRKRDTDSLMAWLVSDTGFSQVVYSKTASPVRKPDIKPSAIVNGFDAQIKMSPDSRYLIVPRRTYAFPYHELYRFNNATGVFTGPIYIKDTTNSSPNFYLNGCPDGCFSPDSKKLYMAIGTRTKLNEFNQTDEGKGTVWQYDVSVFDSLAIAQSKLFVGRFGRKAPNVWSYPPTPRMQLALNGKIYISPGSISHLDSFLTVMNCPNSVGRNCNIEWFKHKLPGRNGSYFPTLNQTFIRNAGIFQVQANKRTICVGDTLELSGYGAGAEHFSWSVSPALPQGVKLDTVTWQKISTAKIPLGSYTFRCIGSGRCGDVYNQSMVVHIRPKPEKPTPKPAIPAGDLGIILCRYDIIQFSVPDSLKRYYWSTTDTTHVINIMGWNAPGTRWITLITENQYGCQSELSDSIAVTMKEVNPSSKPEISSQPPVNADSGFVALCQGDSIALSASGSQTFIWSDGDRNATRHLTGSGELVLFGYDTAGCAAKAETIFRYKAFPQPQPIFIQGDSALNQNSLFAINYCVPLVMNHHYSWSAFNGTISDTLVDCATVNWNNGNVDRAVEVLQTSPVGCTGSARLDISYHPEIRIPSLITPNNDGKNETLVIQDLDFYPSHHLQLFDRWGRKVLNTKDYGQDWKGEPGIYFLSLVVDGRVFNGWVSVVK